MKLAITGKGGVGKTTVCGMIIDNLIARGKGPLLVVDADANSNLNEVLGVEVETTLGAIREEMAQAELRGDVIPKNMTKADYAEFRFNSALIEEDDFDMLVMGRTQGKGCYCYVNGVLKTGFVVHDHVGIVGNVLGNLGLQYAIDVEVAALALGAAHDQHIEVVVLNEGLTELHLGVVRLGHAGGDGALQLGLSHFLPDLPQRGLHLHAQNLVQVGVGVGVHHEDGAVLLFAQIIDQHAAGGGFTHAALTGNRNGMRHNFTLLCHLEKMRIDN